MPLKRFLTLHGEELNKKHPAIFGTICQELVWKLTWQLDNPVSQKLLIDLVGQPSLLTPVAFARGFFYPSDDTSRANFIKYGYKEAIEEGLKEEYDRWGKVVGSDGEQFPNQFSGEYPSTDEARAVALKDFKPTKQDREEAWIVNNARILKQSSERDNWPNTSTNLALTFQPFSGSSLRSIQLFPHGLALNSNRII